MNVLRPIILPITQLGFLVFILTPTLEMLNAVFKKVTVRLIMALKYMSMFKSLESVNINLHGKGILQM